MKIFTLILFCCYSIFVIQCLTEEQKKEAESVVRSCIFKIRINPLAVNRLRKGDFSKVDEKSQVRVKF